MHPAPGETSWRSRWRRGSAGSVQTRSQQRAASTEHLTNTHDEAARQVRIAFVVGVRRQFRRFAELLERFLCRVTRSLSG